MKMKNLNLSGIVFRVVIDWPSVPADEKGAAFCRHTLGETPEQSAKTASPPTYWAGSPRKDHSTPVGSPWSPRYSYRWLSTPSQSSDPGNRSTPWSWAKRCPRNHPLRTPAVGPSLCGRRENSLTKIKIWQFFHQNSRKNCSLSDTGQYSVQIRPSGFDAEQLLVNHQREAHIDDDAVVDRQSAAKRTTKSKNHS